MAGRDHKINTRSGCLKALQIVLYHRHICVKTPLQHKFGPFGGNKTPTYCTKYTN